MNNLLKTEAFKKIFQENIKNNIVLPEIYCLSTEKNVKESDKFRFLEDSYHFYTIKIHPPEFYSDK